MNKYLINTNVILYAVAYVTGVREVTLMGVSCQPAVVMARALYMDMTEAYGIDGVDACKSIRKNVVGWNTIRRLKAELEHKAYYQEQRDKVIEVIDRKIGKPKPEKPKDDFRVLDVSSNHFGRMYLVLNRDEVLGYSNDVAQAMRLYESLKSRYIKPQRI